ncbi:FtsX-like permease family protein [Amycolatopsis sp. EV170708-02-1]|uniref:FtsX-like permease family protein n=1 Tax=Amycolatopsis sp. EV170708-02-1 TaxID=2919322 RepID=UPI001F0C21CD|nr:FtsX-like permease family protein [Amycolatopsis sp. EV170708-02-1]UMP04715.1 ABC transporter permease [Amycolatopsis sp. EV170708-02-1]
MPWRAAPKAALTSPLTLIIAAVTALLACFLGTAAVLQASAAGGAAVTYQSDIVCPDYYGPVFSKDNVPAAVAPQVIDSVRRNAPAHGFPAPVTSRYTPYLFGTEFNGDPNYKVVLAHRDQALQGHLDLAGGSTGAGFLLGTVVAGAENIKVGATPSIQGTPIPPVTGLYRDLPDPAPRWWCSQQRNAVVSRLANDPLDSVMFANDGKTFDDTIRALNVPMIKTLHLSFYEAPPKTVSEAEDLQERGKALIAAVKADLGSRGLGDAIIGSLPFERSVEISNQAESNVLISILPLAAISILVGCAGIGTVALQWYQRRHPQLRLLSARGSGPAALGLLAVAELGLPIVVGGAAGGVLPRLLLGVYGPPGELNDGATLWGSLVAAAILLVSLALLACVISIRTHREFELGRVRSGRRKKVKLLAFFPWELLTAGIALLGWNRLVDYSKGSRIGNPLPQVDPLALTYPVFVVLTVGLVAARLAWLALHASHRARLWSRPALQLAIRRLASARAPVTGVLVIGTLAIGTLATGIGIARGQEEALQTKSAIFVGAETRVDTESVVGTGKVGLPASIGDSTAIVGELTGSGNVVLVVDPRTFRRSATFGPLDGAEVDRLLGGLSSPGTGVPAIRIGNDPAQKATLPAGLGEARAVGELPMFPIIGTKAGYVVSRDSLSEAQLRSVPKWSLLSSSSMTQVTEALASVGVMTAVNRVTRESALDALPFYVVSWTFSFMALLGAVLGVVAVLSLLVAVEVRRRQNALAGALVLRMGMRPRALLASHLMELGALSGLAVVIGVVCGVSVAGLSVPRFDPATFLPPQSALPDPTPLALTVLAVGVLVVALAGWIAMRSVRTARTAELIRA